MKRISPDKARWIWKILVLFVIISGLSIVILFPPSGFERSEDRGRLLKPSTESATTPSPERADTGSISPEEMEDFIASLKKTTLSHDPFLSSGEQEWKQFLGELKERPPRLKGIIQVAGSRVAIIKDSRYYEGDEVAGFRIVKIEERRVLLSKGGNSYEIHITE
ncbi:MAG: hypothetical protein V2A69_01425 [Pseudomonadota bacterium]